MEASLTLTLSVKNTLKDQFYIDSIKKQKRNQLYMEPVSVNARNFNLNMNCFILCKKIYNIFFY